jgi:hypothetical protein
MYFNVGDIWTDSKYVMIATPETGLQDVEVNATNLNRIINMMAIRGWKCNNLCTFGHYMIALMERV